ncbi:MAG: DPP IV N-terminal domain-containing protein [Holophagae bacterium]|nr:DPP IV N-terminal domain-containing protein [Holophagae bacterium]
MKKLLAILILSVPVWAVQPMDPLFTRTMEAMQTRSTAPFSIKWSPLERYLAYLKPATDAEVNELWVLDLKTNRETKLAGAEQQSKETEAEKELKERMRIGGGGVTFFSWFHDSEKILYKNGGKLWQVLVATGKKQAVSVKLSPLLFPQISPDDTTVSVVSAGDIYLIDIATGTHKQLTRSATEDVYNGMADFNAAEELDRYKGMWWSPDSCFLYFTHVDESRMARWALSGDTEFKPHYQLQRYPVCGGVNADVSLYRVEVKSGHLEQLSVPLENDWYLVRVHFMGLDPAVQILTRNQKDLYIYRYRNIEPQLIYHEHDDCWINLNKSFHYFENRKAFLWTSEKSGINRIYLESLDGKEVSLTHGKQPVLTITGVTEEMVYFTETAANPTENRMMALNLKTGKVVPKEEQQGRIRISMSPDSRHYIVFSSNLNQPVIATLVENGFAHGRRIFFRETSPEISGLAAGIHVPFQFTASDGTTLYGVLDRPEILVPGKKYPVLVYTYGGPHAQVASNSYSSRNELWHRYLNSKGICVFRMDNRGSANRSRAFERAIYHNLGDLELKDQIEGLNTLCKTFAFLDRSRTGIWGWSYGGYMTCMAMTRFAGQFKAGVAVAPVTDWQMYDSAYTERYMGTPEENPDGYKNASILTWAEQLKGNLLIMAGVSDDNVHFQHTGLLLNRFVETNCFPDLMVYPGKKHSIRGRQTRRHLFWRISDYFLSNL